MLTNLRLPPRCAAQPSALPSRSVVAGTAAAILLQLMSHSAAAASDTAPPLWKTINLGTIHSIFQLREALESSSCGKAVVAVADTSTLSRCHLGDDANEALGRQEFTLSPERHIISLVRTTVAGLGFDAAAMPTIKEVYHKAKEVGLAVCPAEAGPQLRLQYLDQPLGEFLLIATPPVSDYAGEPLLFLVGNGGSGLLLVSRAGSLQSQVPTVAEFVFCLPE